MATDTKFRQAGATGRQEKSGDIDHPVLTCRWAAEDDCRRLRDELEAEYRRIREEDPDMVLWEDGTDRPESYRVALEGVMARYEGVKIHHLKGGVTLVAASGGVTRLSGEQVWRRRVQYLAVCTGLVGEDDIRNGFVFVPAGQEGWFTGLRVAKAALSRFGTVEAAWEVASLRAEVAQLQCGLADLQAEQDCAREQADMGNALAGDTLRRGWGDRPRRRTRRSAIDTRPFRV